MEALQGKLVSRFLIGLAVWAVLGQGAAPKDGAASGTLVVNGQSAALKYAYASAQPGFFEKDTEDIRILLCDVELAEAIRGDTFALSRMARAGTLHAVEVVVDAGGNPLTGTIFVQAFNGMMSVSGVHQFAPQSLSRTRVAGRLSMDGPRTFDAVTYRYDASFAAVIPRPPTAAELDAQRASPAGLAADAFLAAVRQRDRTALAALLADAADTRGPGAAFSLDLLQADVPGDSHVVSVTQATASAGSAEAVVNGTRDGIIIEFTLKMVLERGAWKVAGR